MSTLEERIQLNTQAYRATVDAMTDAAVRTEAQARGIDGYETTPAVTLREEVVQKYRNRLRKNAYPSPVAATGPGTPDNLTANPGNDYVTLTDA